MGCVASPWRNWRSEKAWLPPMWKERTQVVGRGSCAHPPHIARQSTATPGLTWRPTGARGRYLSRGRAAGAREKVQAGVAREPWAPSSKAARVRARGRKRVMATRAEQFRAAQERTGRARQPNGGHESAGRRAARAGRTKDRIPNQASHNEARSAGRKGSYEFEIAQGSRPSRKSTRKSNNRQKTDGGLRMTAVNRNSMASARAQRRGGNPI